MTNRGPAVLGWEMEWVTTEQEEQLHLLPSDDLVGHESTRECICGPRAEHLEERDWLIEHHSLDGRETQEE